MACATLTDSDQAPPAAVIDPGPWLETALEQGPTPALVTFDVFDTLVWRRMLHPQDAFLELSAQFPRFASWSRRQAERLATAVCVRLLRREPTLDDIYRVLPFGCERELEIEKQICVINPLCLALIERLSARQIPVAAISDMYLESGQIRELLEACGYPRLPVFSSATVGCTKARGGRLFLSVWQAFGAQGDRSIHVGDNPHSDIAMAQQQGARACLVRTPRDSLLALHPKAAEWNSIAASYRWGEIAIRLHLHLAERPDATAAIDKAVRMILTEAGDAENVRVDELWHRIEKQINTRTVESGEHTGVR